MKPTDLKFPLSGSLHEDRLFIPVLAPAGRDAELVMDLIRKESLTCLHCQSFHMLFDAINKGSGPAVIAEEALKNADIQKLSKWISAQPEWSDLPLIVFTYKYPSSGFYTLTEKYNITFLKRPVQVLTFRGLIRTAIEARRRQYQICDLLTEHIILNEKLDHRADQLQELAMELSDSEYREHRRLAITIHDELQQILVGAQMKLNILQMELEADSDKQDRLDEIEKLMTGALEVTRSLSYELAPPVLQHGTLCAALEWLAEYFEQEYGIQVELKKAKEDIDVIESLRAFLFQSVRELLFNAVKHAETSLVNLKIYQKNNRIYILVSDQGKGFEPESLRLKGGKAGGFGLFSIAERLDLLGGWFDMESKPGKGSRFTLVSPIVKPSSYQKAKRQTLSTRTASDEEKHDKSDLLHRVVVADDHAVFRKGLIAMLQRELYVEVVGEAGNGYDVLKAARDLHPDIILMDVSMPGMNGIEATAIISRELPDIRIIGLSMFEDTIIKNRMLESGADMFLTKSIDSKHLIKAICNKTIFRGQSSFANAKTQGGQLHIL